MPSSESNDHLPIETVKAVAATLPASRDGLGQKKTSLGKRKFKSKKADNKSNKLLLMSTDLRKSQTEIQMIGQFEGITVPIVRNHQNQLANLDDTFITTDDLRKQAGLEILNTVFNSAQATQIPLELSPFEMPGSSLMCSISLLSKHHTTLF